MKQSELRAVIEKEVMDIYHNYDGTDIHFIGVPLGYRYMSLVIELGKRSLGRIGVMISDDPKDTFKMMDGYQADITRYDQPLEDFESVSSDFNEEDIEDFLYANGSYVEEVEYFEPEIKKLYKESNIINPEEIINRVMTILIEEQHQIKAIIEDFQERSVITRIKKWFF